MGSGLERIKKMKDKTTEVETFIDKTFKNFGKTMVVVGVINFALLDLGFG